MQAKVYLRPLAAGLIGLSIAIGAGAVPLGIPSVELTGAYAEATAEAIEFTAFTVDIQTASGSDPVTVDVTTSSSVTGASGAATAGADFPGPDGLGSAARASASVLGTVSSLADSVGTAFIAGDFTVSGAGAGDHTVTFEFDITALVTLADGDAGDDLLTAGLSAFAVVFDDTFEDTFLAGFSLDGGGLLGNTVATRSGDWDDDLLGDDFTEDASLDPSTDCLAAAIGTIPNRCSWGIDTTASITYEYTGDSAAFSLVYGIQTSVLGTGTTYELISDASGTSILTVIEASDGANVVALPSQLQAVPEPTSVALLGLGLLGAAAATRRRRRLRGARC